MPPELAPLAAAAKTGEDLEPHFAALEQQQREAQPDAITKVIQKLREKFS
jgi:hypothetical protein